MSYIVTKMIKGNPYLYQVRSERQGDRVVQVFERYLGRAEKYEGEAPETVPVAREEIPEVLTSAPPETKPTEMEEFGYTATVYRGTKPEKSPTDIETKPIVGEEQMPEFEIPTQKELAGEYPKFQKLLDKFTQVRFDYTSGNEELHDSYISLGSELQKMEKELIEKERKKQKRLQQIKFVPPTPPMPVTGISHKYSATVYRGTKPEKSPTDEGLFGKGTYYTTNREYADTYGETTESRVNLKNPFVISSQREYDEFQAPYRQMRKDLSNQGLNPKDIDERIARQIREDLESAGHDGLISRDVIAPGDEVVVFNPEKSVTHKEA